MPFRRQPTTSRLNAAAHQSTALCGVDGSAHRRVTGERADGPAGGSHNLKYACRLEAPDPTGTTRLDHYSQPAALFNSIPTNYEKRKGCCLTSPKIREYAEPDQRRQMTCSRMLCSKRRLGALSLKLDWWPEVGPRPLLRGLFFICIESFDPDQAGSSNG